jgi:predicted RNase H-like nuclease
MTVLGLDGCRGGWLAIAVDDLGYVDAFVAPSVADAERIGLERSGITAMVIDTPIGIPDAGPRLADIEARRFITPRHSSVFSTPVRAALEAPDYNAARVASLAACGKSLSKQAWAITDKIRDVGAWAAGATVVAREGHPEVSFRAMAGEPILHYKKTLSGAMLRRELLAAEGIDLPGSLDKKALPGVDLDDIHDAAAMAWTARRVARGEAVSLPAEPEVFSDGWPSAIWY